MWRIITLRLTYAVRYLLFAATEEQRRASILIVYMALSRAASALA